MSNFNDDDLWYAFKKSDSDKSGYITVTELRIILANIEQNFSDNEIETIIKNVDSNFDGKLNFQGLRFLIKFFN